MLFRLLFGLGNTVTYTVHEGPQPLQDRMDRAEALRFIKDGFVFPAALLGLFWLLGQRLWFASVLYVMAALAILFANAALGLSDTAALIAFIGLNLYVGFEADRLERAALEAKGWTSLGAVTGTNALDCERRFFDEWLPLQPVLTTKAPAGSVPSTMAPTDVPPSRGAAAGRFAALLRGGGRA
jgi:hypothetical protein